MKIKYCGTARDYSGYGEAARHDIGALVQTGINLTTEIPSYCLEISDFGKLGELALALENKPIGYKIKILHTTPNVYGQFFEEDKYHIARVFWETDKLPLDFSINVQKCDEIWTGSKFNEQAIRNAGVTQPVYIIPEAIDISVTRDDFKPYLVSNKADFKFYSVFEWTERKNPAALLEAFWLEFENEVNVSLTIKTYLDNFTPNKRDELNQNIKRIKKKLNLTKYAPVYIYRNLMDRNQIYRFHATFDCFVSTHRGEGWGIPQMEAMLMGNPVISTGIGGIHEYLENNKEVILLPFKMIPVVENNRNQQWYTRDQHWAEVSIPEVREAMRWIFANRNLAIEMGLAGRKKVIENFSFKAVGGKMYQRLQEIQNSFIDLEQ